MKANILVWNVMNLSPNIVRKGDRGMIPIEDRAVLIGQMIGQMEPQPDIIVLLETGDENDNETVNQIAHSASKVSEAKKYNVIVSEPTSTHDGPETYSMLFDNTNKELKSILNIPENHSNKQSACYYTTMPILSSGSGYRGGWVIKTVKAAAKEGKKAKEKHFNLGFIHAPSTANTAIDIIDDIDNLSCFKPLKKQTEVVKKVKRRMQTVLNFVNEVDKISGGFFFSGDLNIPTDYNDDFRTLFPDAPNWGPKDGTSAAKTSLRNASTIAKEARRPSPEYLLNPFDQGFATVTFTKQSNTPRIAQLEFPKAGMKSKVEKIWQVLSNHLEWVKNKLPGGHNGTRSHLPNAIDIDLSQHCLHVASTGVTTYYGESNYDYQEAYDYINGTTTSIASRVKRTSAYSSVGLEKLFNELIESLNKIGKKNTSGGVGTLINTQTPLEYANTLQALAETWAVAEFFIDQMEDREIPNYGTPAYYMLHRALISDHLPVLYTLELP